MYPTTLYYKSKILVLWITTFLKSTVKFSLQNLSKYFYMEYPQGDFKPAAFRDDGKLAESPHTLVIFDAKIGLSWLVVTQVIGLEV